MKQTIIQLPPEVTMMQIRQALHGMNLAFRAINNHDGDRVILTEHKQAERLATIGGKVVGHE